MRIFHTKNMQDKVPRQCSSDVCSILLFILKLSYGLTETRKNEANPFKASIRSEFMLLLPNVDLFLHKRRPYELQCIVLTGCVKSRMEDLTLHFTVSLDLSWSVAGTFRQFESPVYMFVHFNSLTN